MSNISDKVRLLAKRETSASVLDALLEARGITDKDEFFNPEKKALVSPFVFSDMEKAVNLIYEAIKNNEKILIWGDFDCDGVTSTSILYKALKALGADCDYFLPDRVKMGHGLNSKELITRTSKQALKLLITVDCGISSNKEINLLKLHGVKVIVTDHHEPPEVLPNADCILNPLVPNSLKEDLPVKTIQNISYISGAGVAFKLAQALLGDNHPLLNELISISAVGIIADVVPLLGESRTITAKGIEAINNNSLKGVSMLLNKASNKQKYDSIDIAFLLAPRINAAGRLATPYDSIKLLIEDNEDVLNITIDTLDELNKVRQSLCETVSNEAMEAMKTVSDAIVLYNENWHIGIIGIVASKLVEKFNLPAFLITKDETDTFRCSIRSPEGYDVAEILTSMKNYFLGFGGHKSAGGFSACASQYSFEELKEKILEAVKANKDETKISDKLTADIELYGDDLTFELLDDIEKLQPFGAENKKPLFLFDEATVISQNIIGKEANHLSFKVQKDNLTFECLIWNRTVLGVNNGDKISFIFRPESNEFMGKKTIKLMVEKIVDDKLQETKTGGLKVFDHRQKTGILDKVADYVASKNGEIKLYAFSLKAKKLLSKYPALVDNIISDINKKEKTVMFFDYPSTPVEFKETIDSIKPDTIHIMKNDFSTNPDEYILNICGMLKFATKNKDGRINIKTVAQNLEVDEICVQSALELLENVESVQITDDGRIFFVKPPNQTVIHTDSMFEIFKDEFERNNNFKRYLQTATTDEIEELLKD